MHLTSLVIVKRIKRTQTMWFWRPFVYLGVASILHPAKLLKMWHIVTRQIVATLEF